MSGVYKNIICTHGSHPEFFPQKHQTELLNYFLYTSKEKGLLAYHRLGSGKSCSSIMISDEMIKTAKAKKVFIMTPGSLRQNFLEEYCDRCGKSPEYLKNHYIFITVNYSVGERLPDFNGGLVIIDEVHNLINGVKNQSKHATLIYNAINNSKCRVLALTGTPVFNYIWEWPLLGNMLKPNTFPNIIRHGQLDEEAFMKIFIIDKDGNVTPKNPKSFAVDLRGIISYFPGVQGGFYPEVFYEEPIRVQMTIPQEYAYLNVVDWEEAIRQKGPPEKSLLKSNPRKYYQDMNDFIVASKYIVSRLYSNFYYPTKPDNFRSGVLPESRDEIKHIGKVVKYKYKPTGEIAPTQKYFVDKYYSLAIDEYVVKHNIKPPQPTKGGKDKNKKQSDEAGIPPADLLKITKKVEDRVKANTVQEFEIENIGWVDHTNFSQNRLMDVYSRKFSALIVNIIKNWNAKHMVFTFFKTKGGVNLVNSLFKMCGIKTEIYSGDISDSRRRIILKEFNAEKNRYGDKIKALLVTEAGAEGINVLETQHMHILESSTREMKIQQAIGRIVRYKSHMVEGRKPMPKSEQVVHVWRYWSIMNAMPTVIAREITNDNGLIEKLTKTVTNKTGVDQILYNKGRIFVNTMQSFLQLLKNASVTTYDKSQDTGSRLKDYGYQTNINPQLELAYKISDDRFINSDDAKKLGGNTPYKGDQDPEEDNIVNLVDEEIDTAIDKKIDKKLTSDKSD
jgi:hypothetical protein